jgi:hypothetical protein
MHLHILHMRSCFKSHGYPQVSEENQLKIVQEDGLQLLIGLLRSPNENVVEQVRKILCACVCVCVCVFVCLCTSVVHFTTCT